MRVLVATVALLALAACVAAQDEFLCDAPVDIMFSLDDSGSIGGNLGDVATESSDFGRLRSFGKKITEKLKIGPDNVWVGVSQWDHRVDIPVPLGSDSDAALNFWENVNRLPGSDKFTNTGGGVSSSMEQFARYGRVNRAKFLLLIADGGTNVGPEADRIARMVREHESSITIFVIGIGVSGSSEDNLKEIASYPWEKHYIATNNFAELEQTLDRVLAEACIPCPLTCCGHGFCNPSGTPPCVCEQGYTGDDCCTVAPDWLVPLAGATTGVVFLAAVAALMFGAMKHGTGSLPVPIEEIEIEEEPDLEEVEVMAMEEPVFAGELDLDTDTGAIGTGAQGPAKPNAGSIFRGWAPQIAGANTVKSTRDPGAGVAMADGSKKYTPFDLPKRF